MSRPLRFQFGVSSFCLIALTIACAGEKSDDLAPAEFDANAQVAAWVELWNTYDLVRVDELFLDDARVTYFSSEREGLIEGPSEIRAHHEGFGFVEGGQAPAQELWVENVRSNAFGATVVVGGIWYFGDRQAVRDSVSHGPMTIVYTWADKRYRIAHMHFANY